MLPLSPPTPRAQKKISPGFSLLTWTSMNIDGYVHRFKQGLARLEELVRKVRLTSSREAMLSC